MPRVVLQPRGSAAVQGPTHFAKSVRKGIRLSDYAVQFGPDFELLRGIYPDGVARLWGSTPTNQTGNAKAVALRERQPGDVVLFYADNSFIASARLVALMRNRPAARAIWGSDDDGATWEHMMALTDVVEFDDPIPSAEILEPLGRNRTLRSLTRLDAVDSTDTLARIGHLTPSNDGEDDESVDTAYWWSADPDERYWVEIRWEEGIGTNLACSLFKADGSRDSFHDLVGLVKDGDVVYHWHAHESAFVGRSIVDGAASLDNGWREALLREFTPVAEVDLQTVRDHEKQIRTVRDELSAAAPGERLYMPFQFRQTDLRFISNYFAKLPAALVGELFGDDGLGGYSTDTSPESDTDWGGPDPGVSRRGFLQPFKAKSDAQYRSKILGGTQVKSRHHEKLVNDAAAWLQARGLQPACNQAIDLGIAEPAVVFEAKILGKRPPQQIRAAVGQLYEYRYWQLVAPESGLILLVDEALSDEWVDYLENDRQIGLLWRTANGFSLSKLAERNLEATA